MKHRFLRQLVPALRSLPYYLRGLYRGFREENVFFLSSGLAFNGVLCLIPVLLLLTSLLGMFIQSSRFPEQRVNDLLSAVFPPQPYAQKIKMSILGVILDIARYRKTFGITGIAIFGWTATSLFGALRIVLNQIYRIKAKKLVVIKVFENIILVILMGVLFFIANALTWFFLLINSLLKELPTPDVIDLEYIAKTIPILLSYLSALIMFYVINRHIPDEKIPRKAALVSAFTATSLWWLAGKGFGWYLTTFHPYSKLYGTYAFLLVFLAWIYYSSIVFVIGIIIGQLYRERPMTRS